ncbi:MAG: MarR family transcriptional regulator, partial [Gammaproteobacteria bacterium]|nr:MarR family transcriptional regulator [Gammaproteobacteria bacterium]
MQKDLVDDILDQWSDERPELDSAPLGVVIRVMTLYRSFLREATAALEPLDLELWEYDVLSALRRQGRPYALPATRLARETELSSGAMTNRIDRLQDRRLVRRKPDETDRRGVNI